MSDQRLNEILRERENNHGDYYTNWITVGKIWGALLGIEAIEPYKVGLMMDAFKTVRAFGHPEHEDNWLDKQGYTQHAHSSAFYDVGKRK